MFRAEDVEAKTTLLPRLVAVRLHSLNDLTLSMVVNTADGIDEPVDVKHGHVRHEGNDEDGDDHINRGEFVIDAPKRLGRC